MQETSVQSLGQEDPLEKRMAIHSSISPWRIPWREESDGLQPMDHKELDTTEQLTLHLILISCDEVILKSGEPLIQCDGVLIKAGHLATHTHTHTHTHKENVSEGESRAWADVSMSRGGPAIASKQLEATEEADSSSQPPEGACPADILS